jgi:hypothetical protein
VSAAALSIIARLRDAGATLECNDGGRVRFSAPAPLPAALLAEARHHRDAIANVLNAESAGCVSSWGLTKSERKEGLARLNSIGQLQDAPPSGNPYADVVAWVEQRAAGALGGYEHPHVTPEPEWPLQGTIERHRLDTFNRQVTDGYGRAAARRPPSWWRAEIHRPTPGATCSCCEGHRWWSELADRRGWRCWTCHPPGHLPADAIAEVRT